jgi:poly-gamma-glutamate system protein
VRYERLFILFGVVVVLFFIAHITRTHTTTRYYEMQIAAAEKMDEALDAIKTRRAELGIPSDEATDPLASGIIGLPWPMFDETRTITTTLGILEAKQLSANPNFAALIVRYLSDLNIKSGDYVAINFSGSFPALNIATLAAIEVMELHPIIFSSIGASTYGANHPDFTYVDMEQYLFDEEIISHKSGFVSLGGHNDRLEEVSDLVFKAELLTRFREAGYEIIEMDSLSENIQYRYARYQDLGIALKAFINVGGNQVSFGTNTSYYPNGLIKRMSVSVRSNSGLIERFLRDDIPVIQLLNIEDLARRNDMQTTISTPFVIGDGAMYYDFHYSQWIIIPGLLIAVMLIIGDYLDRKRKRQTR